MESMDELRRFAAQRGRLLEVLAEQRKDLDSWLETHIGPASEVSIHDLANLAGLVKLRRDTLMELVQLNDDVLERFLDRRNAEQEGEEA